jgi:excinuclease UvrABC nuclease subunit
MLEAANNLEFEKAALLRDQVRELKRMQSGEAPDKSGSGKTHYRGKKSGKSRRIRKA